MQPHRNLPSHPSLPVAPHLRQMQSLPGYGQPHVSAGYAQQQATHLQPQSQYGMSSHYAQAYLQYNYAGAPGGQHAPFNDYAAGQSYGQQASTSQFQLPNPSVARWYQHGNVKCSKPGCSFSGSKKSVETHMMDRHLIYPPGWESRKRKDDWDADPSLKGKSILIQGTAAKLDTPEAIEQWIAERKKRFPTADRVAEKQQKLSEAAARGQLALGDRQFPNKKRRLDNDRTSFAPGGPGNRRQQQPTRGSGRRQGKAGSSGMPSPRGASTSTSTIPSSAGLPMKPLALDAYNDSDSDAPPEVTSSKARTEALQGEDPGNIAAQAPAQSEVKPVKRLPPKQPRRPPPNPFTQRPALLRNLLLPEIRMTVSNLSQAIRFLVENNFLENVELMPGQADRKMIEVIKQDDVPAPATINTTGSP